MGFGLKAVAKAMQSHGYINTIWEDGPTDGLGAMVRAWRGYHAAAAAGVPFTQLDICKEIESYNEVDCKVMRDVLKWLRENR